MSDSTKPLTAGQRLSLKGQRLTIRYIGPINGKQGAWVGVEWDDPRRGKHDGSHEGHRYFTCASTSPTAASFIRPTQSWDPTMTFMRALTEKYIDNQMARDTEDIYVSGKQAEEIGFEKFSKRMAEFRGIRVLGLDQMRIVHEDSDGGQSESIKQTCADITDLDIGGNLFDHFSQVLHLTKLMGKLQVLTLAGNRFHINEQMLSRSAASQVQHLNVSNTLQKWADLNILLSTTFPELRSLQAARNEWDVIEASTLPASLHTVGLDENQFTQLEHLQVFHLKSLRRVTLRNNAIAEVGNVPPNSLEDLDLGFNQISDMAFFDHIAAAFPSLKHLRVTGNPVYDNLISAEGKPLNAGDGYILTIARLPQLQTLNFSQIADKDRLNAEVYYLAQIAAELNSAPVDERVKILAKHARWTALCNEYGEPSLTSKSAKEQEIPLNSLAAHLITVTFYVSEDTPASAMQPQTWSRDLPKSWSVYTILGLAGKRLNRMPLSLRLIWETDERDPVQSRHHGRAPEWWDSDDSDVEDVIMHGTSAADKSWVMREVELQAGTRSLGTFIDVPKARVRIEVKDSVHT